MIISDCWSCHTNSTGRNVLEGVEDPSCCVETVDESHSSIVDCQKPFPISCEIHMIDSRAGLSQRLQVHILGAIVEVDFCMVGIISKSKNLTIAWQIYTSNNRRETVGDGLNCYTGESWVDWRDNASEGEEDERKGHRSLKFFKVIFDKQWEFKNTFKYQEKFLWKLKRKKGIPITLWISGWNTRIFSVISEKMKFNSVKGFFKE